MDEKERAYFRCESVGFVFQLFNLLPALTALENVAIPLLIEGASWDDATARAQKVIEAVAFALPAKLSGGEQQRCWRRSHHNHTQGSL
jgi:putative ABC transport system ATP-binding protein